MAKKQLNVNIEESLHKKAKLLSVETGLSIGEIIELLIQNVNESEIRKLAKKK